MSFLVIGFRDPDEDGQRIRCGTAGAAAAQAERFLREGCLWIHIDNVAALDRFRTGLDEHGDALPPLHV